MKCFPATKRDNEREVMRVEITAEDMELLEYAMHALGRLALIEDALGVKGFYSPWLSVPDQPTQTIAAAALIAEFQIGWDGGEFLEMLKNGEIEIAS